MRCLRRPHPGRARGADRVAGEDLLACLRRRPPESAVAAKLPAPPRPGERSPDMTLTAVREGRMTDALATIDDPRGGVAGRRARRRAPGLERDPSRGNHGGGDVRLLAGPALPLTGQASAPPQLAALDAGTGRRNPDSRLVGAVPPRANVAVVTGANLGADRDRRGWGRGPGELAAVALVPPVRRIARPGRLDRGWVPRLLRGARRATAEPSRDAPRRGRAERERDRDRPAVRSSERSAVHVGCAWHTATGTTVGDAAPGDRALSRAGWARRNHP